MALGQGRAAFQLKSEVQLLEAVKAMHDPIVLFDQRRIDAFFARDYADQFGKFGMVVKKLSHEGLGASPAPRRRISSFSRCRNYGLRAADAVRHRTRRVA